jgi:hypothetical protein
MESLLASLSVKDKYGLVFFAGLGILIWLLVIYSVILGVLTLMRGRLRISGKKEIVGIPSRILGLLYLIFGAFFITSAFVYEPSATVFVYWVSIPSFILAILLTVLFSVYKSTEIAQANELPQTARKKSWELILWGGTCYPDIFCAYNT